MRMDCRFNAEYEGSRKLVFLCAMNVLRDIEQVHSYDNLVYTISELLSMRVDDEFIPAPSLLFHARIQSGTSATDVKFYSRTSV